MFINEVFYLLLRDWLLEVLESRKKKHESLCVCVRILILIIVYGSRYNKILQEIQKRKESEQLHTQHVINLHYREGDCYLRLLRRSISHRV